MIKIDRSCKNNRCKRRDDNFGVTWCIKCGRLFNKPFEKFITEKDINKYNCLSAKKYIL